MWPNKKPPTRGVNRDRISGTASANGCALWRPLGDWSIII